MNTISKLALKQIENLAEMLQCTEETNLVNGTTILNIGETLSQAVKIIDESEKLAEEQELKDMTIRDNY